MCDEHTATTDGEWKEKYYSEKGLPGSNYKIIIFASSTPCKFMPPCVDIYFLSYQLEYVTQR